MIEAQNLAVCLGSRRVICPMDFVLERGEIVGLIGPNGSGKSTLLRALVGLLPAESGRVLLDGKPVHLLPPGETARSLAYLPQSPECHWPLTAGRVVALGRLPFGDFGDRDVSHVDRALAAVDALHLRERAVTELSGGERARVFLARALAGDPSWLLTDEPGTGLDPYHQLALMELLQSLAREGRGVLVVLHDLGLAARFCQRLILLNHGELLASGSPECVLADPLLALGHRIHAFRGEYRGSPVLVPWERADDGAEVPGFHDPFTK